MVGGSFAVTVQYLIWTIVVGGSFAVTILNMDYCGPSGVGILCI